MLFDGVLLASDFDGTFVTTEGKITEGVRQAVRFFTDNGGRFTICTGRTHLGFHAYSPDYINAPVVLAGGGLIYDYAASKPVLINGVGDEALEALQAVAVRFPQLCIDLYAPDCAHSVNTSPFAIEHFNSQSIPYRTIADPAESPRPWPKVALGGDCKDIAKAQIFLKEHFPHIHFLPTDGVFLEILRPGVDKGSGLLALADHLGIGHRHVYAVGDGYNDREMLHAAAIGFVPANGDAVAKSCAGQIVRSNDEDAVAHVIEILAEMYANSSR